MLLLPKASLHSFDKQCLKRFRRRGEIIPSFHRIVNCLKQEPGAGIWFNLFVLRWYFFDVAFKGRNFAFKEGRVIMK